MSIPDHFHRVAYWVCPICNPSPPPKPGQGSKNRDDQLAAGAFDSTPLKCADGSAAADLDRAKLVARLRATSSQAFGAWPWELCLLAADQIVADGERIAEAHRDWKNCLKVINNNDERIAFLEQALRIIAGYEQCVDNLMGNVDIARAALKGKS